MELVVHIKGVAAVRIVLQRVVGRRLGAELGVAAEGDLDLGLGRGACPTRMPALTSAVLPSSRL
jgi:hypothetical protein